MIERRSAATRSRGWRRVLRVVGGFVIVYVTVCACLFVFQRRLLFAPPSMPCTVEGSADVELLSSRAKDGVDVNAAFVRAAAGKATLVWFHGNAEDISGDVARARELRRSHGLGSLAVEYRGYGLSRDVGSPSEQGLYADAEAALDALEERGVARDEVILVGRSLGSGVAAEMAGRGRGLVLVSPFTSIPDVVASVMPVLPVQWLARDRFDTATKAPSITVPTLILHGDSDEVVPYAMGLRLAGLFPHARLVTVVGAHHNDLYEASDPDPVAAMIAFAGADEGL